MRLLQSMHHRHSSTTDGGTPCFMKPYNSRTRTKSLTLSACARSRCRECGMVLSARKKPVELRRTEIVRLACVFKSRSDDACGIEIGIHVPNLIWWCQLMRNMSCAHLSVYIWWKCCGRAHMGACVSSAQHLLSQKAAKHGSSKSSHHQW